MCHLGNMNISHFKSHAFFLEITHKPSAHFNLRIVVIVSENRLAAPLDRYANDFLSRSKELKRGKHSELTYTHRSMNTNSAGNSS